jgi:hypothetical protein
MNEYRNPAENVSSYEEYQALKPKRPGRPGSDANKRAHNAANGEFLPSDYKVPHGPSNYMKLEVGENKLRIMDSPIVGYEWWVVEEDGKRKPMRVHIGQRNPADSKHFWACPVWNYKAKRVQILEITQKSIQRALGALAADSEWGSPLNYDISIVREGEGMESRYQVIPAPHKALDPVIRDTFARTKVSLEALFVGEDPFAQEAHR